VAAICSVRQQVNFEGQAAMEFEMLADASTSRPYDFQWEPGESQRLQTAPIIRGVVADLLNRVPVAEISAKFHRTLIQLFAEFCDGVRREHGLNRVVLSGGCFQNATLLGGLIKALEGKKFEVFSHEQVPANDGGIALGQAVAAAAMSLR